MEENNLNFEIKKDRSNKINLAIAVISLILVSIGLIIYFVGMKKDNNEKVLTIYRDIMYKYLCPEEDCGDNECEVVSKIAVESNDAKILNIDSNSHYVIFEDNGVKIFDANNNNILNTNLSNNYHAYRVMENHLDDKIYGILLIDNEGYMSYYNTSSNTILYNNKTYKFSINEYEYYHIAQVNEKYFSISLDDYVYLLNSNSEKEELKYELLDMGRAIYSPFGTKDDYVILLGTGDDCYIIKAYNPDLKEIYSDGTSCTEIGVVNNKFYVRNDTSGGTPNVLNVYNMQGDLLNSKTYNELKGVEKNYVVYVKDGNLVLENVEDEKESVILTEWQSNWHFNEFTTLTEKSLSMTNDSEKKEGMYVIIDYAGVRVDDNSGMEFCYTKDKEIIKYPVKK